MRSIAADPYQKECESVFKDVGARWVITIKELAATPKPSKRSSLKDSGGAKMGSVYAKIANRLCRVGTRIQATRYIGVSVCLSICVSLCPVGCQSVF